MKNLLIFILLLSHITCYGQRLLEITKIKIYALNFNALYITNIDKKNIKEMKPLYVRIIDENAISYSKLSYYLTTLQECDKECILPDDYRAVFTVYYSNSKKETYYIASGSWGIVKNKKLYNVNYPLIAAIYSFFPDDYFTALYKKYPEIYK